MDYNSKYTGEQVEELLDKINASPEDVATPSGNYPDMTVGKASQADTAAKAINADNATNATNATTAEQATKATTADYATTAGHATTAGVAESAEHATTAESTTHADTAAKADFATDLTGRNEATAEEFTFRPSAGNISIRDDSATIKRIKGNSVVWNQLSQVFPNDNTRSAHGVSAINIAGTHYIECSGTTTAIEGDNNIYVDSDITPKINGVSGHKYIFLVEGCENLQINLYSFVSPSKKITNGGTIVTCTKNELLRYSVSIPTSTPVGTTINEKIRVLYTDLTQMFGAGNEPDTVEEFRALFPGNHYEYNPGQLVSMTANGLFTNGFNQWDGKVEVGYIRDRTGEVYGDQNYLCTDFIRVIPNQKYYINTEQTNGRWGAWYDANKNHIAGIIGYDQGLTAPANAAYVRLTIKTDNSGNPDTFCLNLSHTGVENGKYEPYWDATKDLSIIQKYFPNGMRSAGSIYDEISFDETTQKWVAIQRVGNVDLGSLSWFTSTATPTDNVTNRFFYAQINGLQLGYGTIMISAPYDAIDSHPNSIYSKDKTIYCSENYVGGNSPTAVIIRDSSYNDAASFKSAMSGVMLNYELAEPIITVIEEPINLSYKVGDFGIEQILSDSFSAPFRADIIYQFNATDRIRENSLNIEKLSKTQKDYLPLSGGTMSGQINSQDIKPVEDSTYQLGDSTHKYDNVFSNFFTGNLEGNAKTATVATDLSGRIEDTPEVFTYRPSAGDKSIKDDNAFIRRVKGNSVVWNNKVQLTKTAESSGGITVTVDSDGLLLNGTATENTLIRLVDIGYYNYIGGHKYFLSYRTTGYNSGQVQFVDYSLPIYTEDNATSVIFDVSKTAVCNLIMIVDAGTTLENYRISGVLLTDLTQMFGVGNEPDTVEEFRALYPDSYYPYNAGELRNLVCSGIKTVGFNQWDEQWERGTLNSVGENDDTTTTIRSKNYTPAIGGTDYYVGITSEGFDNIYYLGISWYDSNKQFISKTYCNQRVVTSPINAAYFRIFTNTNSYVYGNTYNNDICINLHHTGWRDGEYEPYKEVTHALPLSQITNGEPLRKAGSVYDEINETHYIKRVGVVDLGSYDWHETPNGTFSTVVNILDIKAVELESNYTCKKYIGVGDPSKIFTGTADNLTISTSAKGRIYIRDDAYKTGTAYAAVPALKASLSGVLLHYELAEPIITPIETPLNLDYQVEDFGTEEALLAEDSAPFSADIVYQFNATDQIRNNSRNIDKLQKSAFTPRGTSAQYIRGDGSYGNRFELSQSTPINDGEFEITDEGNRQFILTPNYYAKSQVTLDNTTTIAVFVTAPEDSHYLAEYWFEFAVDESLPNIEYYQPNNSKAVFRIDGDMMTDAVNILHLISSDGGNTFFGEIRSYSL